MNFFVFYVIGLIIVMLGSSYIVSIRETFQQQQEPEEQLPFFNDHYPTEYHKSEYQIRGENGNKMNSMIVKCKDRQPYDNGEPCKNGSVVTVQVETTQVSPIYYTPGSFTYSPAAYEPSYEDAIRLSMVKSQMKKVMRE